MCCIYLAVPEVCVHSVVVTWMKILKVSTGRLLPERRRNKPEFTEESPNIRSVIKFSTSSELYRQFKTTLHAWIAVRVPKHDHNYISLHLASSQWLPFDWRTLCELSWELPIMTFPTKTMGGKPRGLHWRCSVYGEVYWRHQSFSIYRDQKK